MTDTTAHTICVAGSVGAEFEITRVSYAILFAVLASSKPSPAPGSPRSPLEPARLLANSCAASFSNSWLGRAYSLAWYPVIFWLCWYTGFAFFFLRCCKLHPPQTSIPRPPPETPTYATHQNKSTEKEKGDGKGSTHENGGQDDARHGTGRPTMPRSEQGERKEGWKQAHQAKREHPTAQARRGGAGEQASMNTNLPNRCSDPLVRPNPTEPVSRPSGDQPTLSRACRADGDAHDRVLVALEHELGLGRLGVPKLDAPVL